MRNNRVVTTIITVLVGIIISGTASSAPDPLWQRAVALTQKSAVSLPRKMKEVETVVDESGKQLEKTVSYYDVEILKGKGTRAVLVKSMKNGVDNKTAKAKELADMGDSGEHLNTDNLFHPSAQTRVKVRSVEKNKKINGIDCAVFEFTHRTSDGVLKGRAFLNVLTGAPVKTTSRMVKLPEKKNDVVFKSIAMDTWYTSTETGRFRVEKIHITTKLEVTSFWFVKQDCTVNTHVTFSDYR